MFWAPQGRLTALPLFKLEICAFPCHLDRPGSLLGDIEPTVVCRCVRWISLVTTVGIALDTHLRLHGIVLPLALDHFRLLSLFEVEHELPTARFVFLEWLFNDSSSLDGCLLVGLYILFVQEPRRYETLLLSLGSPLLSFVVRSRRLLTWTKRTDCRFRLSIGGTVHLSGTWAPWTRGRRMSLLLWF